MFYFQLATPGGIFGPLKQVLALFWPFQAAKAKTHFILSKRVISLKKFN